jgi:hypothetical protein
MEAEKNKLSNNGKHQEYDSSLDKLKLALHRNETASSRRQAAFHLSWKQEDGLEILKDTLFGNFPKPVKTAATYGLRKMQGRMKKMAWKVLEKGLKNENKETREVCIHAMDLLNNPKRTRPRTKQRSKKPRFRIQSVQNPYHRKSPQIKPHPNRR